jgi:hypothetical protein
VKKRIAGIRVFPRISTAASQRFLSTGCRVRRQNLPSSPRSDGLSSSDKSPERRWGPADVATDLVRHFLAAMITGNFGDGESKFIFYFRIGRENITGFWEPKSDKTAASFRGRVPRLPNLENAIPAASRDVMTSTRSRDSTKTGNVTRDLGDDGRAINPRKQTPTAKH